MTDIFYGVTLSTPNYDALLIGWDALELQNNVTFNGGNSKYTTGSVASIARANIISTDSWTFTDGGFVNKPSPLNKKDVIGSILAWSNISSRFAETSISSIFSRLNWLDRQKDSSKTSHQGVKIVFENKIIDAVMKASVKPSMFSEIDYADKVTALLQNTDGSLVAIGEHIKSDVINASINEAARLRQNVIGSLNPSFGTVINDWSVWTEGKVAIGKVDASLKASKLKSDSQSITLGFDKPLGVDGLMGFALTIGQDDTGVGTDATNVKSDNFSLSSYNVFKPANINIQIEGVIGVGRLGFDTVRTDGLDTLTGTRKANQSFVSATLRPRDAISQGNWIVSPYGKLSLANTDLKSFSESGGTTALTYNKQKVKDTTVGIGIDVKAQIKTNNSTINPFAKIELNQSKTKTSASMNYSNEDASTYTYTTNLDSANKNWKVQLGADLKTKSDWDVSVSYTREQSFNLSKDTSSSNVLSFDVGVWF
jgi:outer membrane autotransporter protein